MSPLFSTAYFPPVSYFSDCLKHDTIYLEKYEHFIKQTYRNRCYIYGPNGKQALIIPLDHKDIYDIPIKDVRISNDTRWNKIHWKSICSAYRNSPYFEFFEEDLAAIFSQPDEFIFDFNLRLFKFILVSFKLKKEILFTDEFKNYSEDEEDFRLKYHPGKSNPVEIKYHQVFEDKHGFIPDLSVLDLLLNEGPQFNK